jgi:murein DD-endopeptidase MepM/ murein hydrolase activator NlpD
MGSFYDDFKKKQNKSQNKPTLIKVPQVAPKSNDRRATAARNREQQRVQAHGGQTQTTQRVNTQQRTTVRQNTSAGSSQRSTPVVQRTQSTQQNSFGLRSPQQLLNSAQSSSIANVNRFSAKQAAQQRRNPRQTVSTANKSSGDGNPTLTQLLKNSMDWHKTSDPNRKAQLHAQNDALRRKLGYEYNPQTGASFDKYGHEMTAGVRMAYGSKPTERLNQATQLLHTSGVMGKTDKTTVYPTAMQAAQGLDEDYFSGQTGYNAHKTMHDLFNRSDETWSSEDTQSRDRARKELSNEMSRIMKRYGLDYQPRDNADDIMNRLKAAGADEQTLAYVQENIDLRHAADRLGNSMEAVGKRWIASLPSLVDTSRQVSANVEESRQNEEYRQLEEQEHTLELTLQGMNSTAADGSVPADYQAMYDQLQEVRKRKNELTVNKGVDPNKWSQRMLREANEAQANAEAGLAPAPRWLTEQGISLAGNAPVMAASAIPVVGPAVGSIMMGGQAAGQRSFELNEQGKGARESLTRGLTSGAIEAATERLPLGQMSKILHSGGVNAVKNILIQMGEEATEESASYFLNYVADLAANDPDAKFSLAELTQSAAGGAFGGLVFGTAGAVGSRAATDTERMNAADAYDYNQVQQLVQIDSELQAALKLPEGPIRERAVQTAQNKMADKISGLMTQQAAQNAELTANYDADLNNRMSLAQRAQAAEYLNQRTGQVDAWQDGQIKPRLGTETEQRAESSYRTPEEEYALQSQLAKHFAEEQQAETGGVYDKATVQQADAAQHRTLNEVISSNHDTIAQTGVLAVLKDEEFAGSKKKLVDRVTDFFNSIGNKVFRAGFGDVTLTRSGARDSISHGMGRNKAIAFSAVPEVIENGAIIDTQSNWKGRRYDTVTFGGQVQIGEQVYDMGVIVKKYDNADMASKYYLHEVVLTNEKGETMSFMTGTKMGYPSDTVSPDGSDIPSVDNSIRQNVGNSNTSDTNIPLSEAMQYGRTPEQAVMEARAKAEGEKFSAGVNANGSINGDTDTAYSIGFMQKRNHPSSAGSSSAPFGRGAQNTRMVYDNSITPDGAKSNTFGFTPEQIAKGTVPLSDAMQYGKTPEQAVMEANARAEGERARNGYEKGETMSFKTGTREGYPSDTVSPDGSDIPSVDNSISPNAENGNTEVKPLGNYEMYGKSREQAMRELQNKLTEKRSFLHDDDYKQVRAVQSAELRETWEQARPVHEQIEKFQKNHPLSAKDEQLLQAAMVNGATDTFSQCDDPAAVMHRYQLQQELNRRMQPIKDYQRARGETMALNAEEMADTIAEFAKDKKIPGAYSRETMERNSYDIFGKNNRDKAEQLNDEYFAPVHKAVADRTNYVNTMRQQVADLHLSKHESALVQMALEGRNDVAAEYIKNNKIKITSALQKNVADGVATFQAIYKELYEAINETLLSNGMEPVRARKNYAPHFVKDKPDTLLSRIRYSFGWGKDSSVNIGTDLAGITDDFSPGKKWFGNLLQREGELTDYDAVAGFDRYIETAGDVIFLTDSVQQLRSLEDALRYRLSDEGTREKVNQIRNDRSLNALERHQKIQDAYDSNTDNIQKLYNQKKQGMGGYVSNLHEYINNLAGKKARADRGWEEMIGRQMYSVAKNVEGRVAANMIAMNPGSWITNFIPITQVSGEVSTANLIKAMRDTVKSAVKDDGFTDGSVFLTNREGTQFLDRTLTRKISDIAGMPMEAIDHFASNVVTRAKYLQNIQDGMGLQEAFDNADTFAANLMADRSKGAQPTAFNSVNPVRKVFTMFQLEVNNQLSYLFKDLPRAKQSVPKLAWAYTKVFTGAYLFNTVYHQLTGRDSAFDPIGMVGDAFDLDPLELIAEAFGLGDDDDKDKKKKSGVDIALDLGKNVAEQVPFVGGLLGGGRVPISSAFPDFGKLIEEHENGYDNKRIALDAAKSAANSAAYLLLPFGGGALKRTAEGAATVYAGGSYSLDKNGEKILQFPQYGQSPRDWAQAMLFGKSSLQGAQEWADDDYQSLNADETKAFDELRQHMNWFKDENGNTIDNSEAVFAAIKAMRAITGEMKEKYPDDYTAIAAGKKREMLFNDNDLNEIQKKYLDRELIGSSVGASGDYSSRDMFDISQKVREARQDDAMEALKHGISVDEFANWDGIIEETLADNEVDAKDFVEGQNNELYKKNEALLAILNEYGNSGEHTDAEKNAFADYLLISAMEDSDKERWDEVKGTVNATDFVKFASDMTTYNKEYKGSGLSKSDAMQSILDGYKNLSDTQKDALFGVYSDSASGNAFHISKYEEAIKDNSFYSYLKDAGKKELRSLLNSYEKHVADNAKLDDWEAKAAVAKEAGISPGIYALFQVALQEADTDGKGLSQAKAKAAVESIDGLSQAQKAYLWQSSNRKWKKNPFGSATVSEYKYAGGEFANPVEGGTISSKFGPRDTFATSNGASSSRWHKSIDIAAPAGTAIKSVQGGKVTANGWVSGYGWTIEVTHDNGYVSMYHHMQNQSSVAVGTEVKQGQTIGNVGSTGNSTGPHLDLTITKDGTPVDPASLIGDYKNAKTGYVYEGSPVYTQLSSAASKSKKSSGGSSRSSGGSSSGGLKQLKGLSGLKGLGF